MAQDSITEQDLAGLLQRQAAANERLMNGDVKGYLALITPAEDFTLLSPFGGPPTRGFDASPEHLEAMERFFRTGKTSLEVVQTYASGDMAVLVVIERQRAEVGGLPEQDWSLRVTLVFRRQGTQWLLVHRHADSLVPGITLEQAAALARG